MRYSVETTFNPTNRTLTIPGEFGIENVCLIVDETIKVCICSSMLKSNIENVVNSSGNTIFTIDVDFFNNNLMSAQNTDLITFLIEDFKNINDILNVLESYTYECELEQNEDGEDTYTMKLNQLGRVIDNTLVLDLILSNE